jgi:hypothetical protein
MFVPKLEAAVQQGGCYAKVDNYNWQYDGPFSQPEASTDGITGHLNQLVETNKEANS